MKYLTKLVQADQQIFTSKELAMLFNIDNPNYLAVVVNRLIKAGALLRIRKGLFSLPAPRVNRHQLANRLKTPSYISLECVLYTNNIIFQNFDNIITSVSNNTCTITLMGTEFRYFKIKPEIMSSPIGIKIGKTTIASPERALADTIYLRGNIHLDNPKPLNPYLLQRIAQMYNQRVQSYIQKLCSTLNSIAK